MPDQKISDLGDGGAPQPTDEFVIARGTTNNKLDWASMSAAATAGNLAATISGNTAGAGALVSTGTVTLAGGNNITLSQAGNAITISGAAAGGAQTAISGIAASNTTYTSGTVTLTGVGGGVTVSSNTGQRVDISVAAPVAQTVQTQNVHNVTLSGNTAGVMAQVSSGTLTLAGGNNITVSQNGNAVTISGANVGGAQTGISGIAASNTTYTSGSVTITGVGGGITVSSNTGQRIDLSVAAQCVQPETQTFVARHPELSDHVHEWHGQPLGGRGQPDHPLHHRSGVPVLCLTDGAAGDADGHLRDREQLRRRTRAERSP